MDAMTHRKRRHIDVCLSDPVEFDGVTTGLDRYRLPYHALTQTSLGDIDVSTSFFGANLRAPILIGAMTGGAEMSKTINRNLAAAAQQLGIGMMLGSQRIMLDSALGERAADSFAVRDVAPDVLLFGNIGLSQLAKTAVPHLVKALDRVGADALAVHTNPLQEAMQHNGDTDFSGSLSKLREAAAALDYPVLLKEVGHGIGGAAAAELVGEKDNRRSPVLTWRVPEALPGRASNSSCGTASYAIRTWRTGVCPPRARSSRCAGCCRRSPWWPPVVFRTGMDAAKAIALGADVVAVARPLLPAAIESSAAVVDWLRPFIDELRVCLHGCGVADLAGLRALELIRLA